MCCYTAGAARMVVRQEEILLGYTVQHKGHLKVPGAHFKSQKHTIPEKGYVINN